MTCHLLVVCSPVSVWTGVAARACAQTNSDADNIIPDHVTLRGTLRALTHEHMTHMRQRIEEAVPAVVSAFRWVHW